ncbi:hypothetical protein POX_b02678 [Penicillium oxalicum]|uniref:hypothetical protein n=1 Tax=Penicillium oxalicum TaxID=69781 RepID=UPI0020B8EA4B|nr:hypothetical protein POX_b02678 [Penicillium oxalicum]KAI2792638.1 hypothetical protein POX_b02678 [Penicillium oxalicum]
MHSPSPQLLRALRTTLLSVHARGSLRGVSRLPTAVTTFNAPSSTRNSSSHIQPARMIPRSHTHKPTTHDRGPESQEDTQTDFGTLDVLGNTPVPSTAIDACLDSGFHLNSGVKITGGDALLLVGGEAFSWRPWKAFEDMLILGLGGGMYPLSPATKRHINSLGIRVDIQDTRNAAAQFNLLATERGVSEIAAALIPIGWKG